MKEKINRLFYIFLFCLFVFLSIPRVSTAEQEEFVFGMIMFGAQDDRGWNQAHYEAGLYVEEMLPGTRMMAIENVNPADRPGLTIQQLVNDLVLKGAKLIISTSDYFESGIQEAALLHPDIYFIQIPGDNATTGEDPENISYLMSRMEYGKMMAGFTAAMTSVTGKIGYIGPLVNTQTRRLAVACYLGARYAWEKILNKNTDDFRFKVVWTGYWFNIPGVTVEAGELASNFYKSGYDVVISGIDSIEALVVAIKERQQNNNVWAMPYNYKAVCPYWGDTCLGVPYFNWGPDYVKIIEAAMSKQWEKHWIWSGPYWADINDKDKSAIGFIPGPGLPLDIQAHLDNFIEDLGSGELVLFQGPLDFQDGTPFLKEGEIATDNQILNIKKLLKGMQGRNAIR